MPQCGQRGRSLPCGAGGGLHIAGATASRPSVNRPQSPPAWVGRLSEPPGSFLKTEALESGRRPVSASLLEVSHGGPFPGSAGREGEGAVHKATGRRDMQEKTLVRMPLIFN